MNSKGGNNPVADISITHPLSINFGKNTLEKKNLVFMEGGMTNNLTSSLNWVLA